MNRRIFGRTASAVVVLVARVRAAASVLLALALVVAPAAAHAGSWSNASPLTARHSHTATLLPSGEVLVAGGNQGTYAFLDSAQRYDPATNTWSNAGTLVARDAHTATLLPSGKVLVAGGYGNGGPLGSAQLYDPATNAWSDAGTLAARSAHTATLLPSGKVLVVGGLAYNQALASAQLYDPAMNTWSDAGTPIARHSHTATLLPSGRVLVTGGASNYNGDALASAQLYDPATNTWSDAGTLVARHSHTATLLPSGKVLVAGGYGSGAPLGSAQVYDPAANTWGDAGTLIGRAAHTATLLPSGLVLVAGGTGADGTGLASAQSYDPATNTWEDAGALTARFAHTATLLPSGLVLVAGGNGNLGTITYALASAQLYEPVESAWRSVAMMGTARQNHTATLLPSGKVLVAGGTDDQTTNVLGSAQLYDPAANTWTDASSPIARSSHTATLLPSGKVLVTGGYGGPGSGYLASAQLYDPATNAWSDAGTLIARSSHTATLLPSGKVLVAGGYGNGPLGSAQIYDPATNSWSDAGALTARANHTATLLPSGKVLVAGGQSYGQSLVDAQLYDPATDTWSDAGSLAARANHTATLLTSGKVLVAGGIGNDPATVASAQLYDPATNTWSDAGALIARHRHTATLLPSGKVLVAGGSGYSSVNVLNSAQLYDPATNTWSEIGPLNGRGYHTATLLPSGRVLVAGGYNGGTLASAQLHDPAQPAWTSAASMDAARADHTATLLPSGRVLVAGGHGDSVILLSNARLYDPATDAWSDAGSPPGRRSHTATLLPSGKVLVAGGVGDSDLLHSAQSYDPATNTWSDAGSPIARYRHTATLLASGKVLVTGGYSGGSFPAAQSYDPATNAWSDAGTPTGRANHTATLLPSGKVLVAGGDDGLDILGSAQLYDPATNTWSDAGTLIARSGHTATLLPSGKVLVAGGTARGTYPAKAQLYDPSTNTWSDAGSLIPRYDHTATLLPSGKVLVAGGYGGQTGGTLASAQSYDPITNTWSDAGALSPRADHTATLLTSGEVLMVGGKTTGFTYLASAYRFDSGLAPVAARRPNLSAANSFLLQTSALAATAGGSAYDAAGAVTATGFMPRLEAGSGGTPSTAGNVPVFQVQRIDNEQVHFIPADGSVSTTDTVFTGNATAFAGFPAGPVRVRAWVNGVPSAERVATLAVTPGRTVAPVATGGVLQASVAITPPVDDGGAPIQSYVATATPGGATASCNAPCSSLAFERLSPGTYTFAVSAVNAAGTGPASDSNSVVVTQATTQMDWPAPAPIVYGTALGTAQLNASARHGGNPVAGTFTYTPAAGSVLGGGADQMLSVAFVPDIPANYTSASATTTITVVRATTTTTLANLPASPVHGQAVTLTATVALPAGNVGIATGTVAFRDGGTPLADCAAVIVSSGQASCQAASLATGAHALTATYTPDAASIANVEGSSATATLTVARAEQAALSLATTPNLLIPGMTSQLAASGGSGSGGLSYGVDSGPCSVSGSVAAATGVGACLVRATRAGDANYNAASATATIIVQAAVLPAAQAQSASVTFNTARTIQLAGSDGNIGGPYALTYALGSSPQHGTIGAFNASAGTLTYTPNAGYLGADAFTFTVQSANGISPAATVALDVVAAPLALRIADGSRFARYGRVVDYSVTLTADSAAANAVPVTFTLSAGLDGAAAQITCTGAGTGASCDAEAGNPLRYTATLPASRTLTWLVSVPVRSDAAGDEVTLTVSAIGAGSVADAKTLVIFKDGFDAAASGSMQGVGVIEGAQARALFDGGDEAAQAETLPVAMPRDASADRLPAPALIVRDGSREARIEATTRGEAAFARLLGRDANGERASAWSRVEPGIVLRLGSVAGIDAGHRVLMLEGAQAVLALELSGE